MRNVEYISASAGSGKTYTLTHRLADAIRDHEIAPEQVILTTYTVKAAAEFREKAKAALHEAGLHNEAIRLDQAMIGTVHSVADAFIHQYWYRLGISPELNVMTDEDKDFFINQSLASLPSQYPELMTGRITLQEKGMYRIRTVTGEQNALVSGRFQFDAQAVSDYPAVGDYVMADCADPDTAVIHQVLPRKSLFVRKAAGTSKTEQVVAANIDTVFLCMSLNNDFNLRRLARYLAVAWESGADPVVLLTKADLCEDISRKQAELTSKLFSSLYLENELQNRLPHGRLF